MHANPYAAHEAWWTPRFVRRGVIPFRLVVGLTLGVLTLVLPWGYPASRAAPWLSGAAIVYVAGIVAVRFNTGARVMPDGFLALLIALLAGYAWGHWRIGEVLQARLPNCVDAAPRSFELVILDVPQRESGGERRDRGARLAPDVVRFTARVWLSPDPVCPGLDEHRVRLAWYDPPTLLPGQHWRVEGRLRPPWGYRNSAGFDYERWLLGQGLNGTGYVRTGRLESQDDVPTSGHPDLRKQLREAIEARDLAQGPFILALLLGDDSRISARAWQVLRDSGTLHLFVVSGLHVGMIAGLIFQLGRGLTRLCPVLLLQVGSRRMASALAGMGSGAYVWLTGAGVPAMRAWLMSIATLALLSAGRKVSLQRVLMLVLAVVVLADPLLVHQQGFWLSFAAVLALVGYFRPRIPGDPREGFFRWRESLYQLLTAQLVLFFSLSPLLAMDVGGIPLVAPLANAVAVPLMTVVVLPLVLAAGPLLYLWPGGADALLGWADCLLGVLVDGVTLGAGVPGMAMGAVGGWEWLVLAVVVLLLGRAPGLVGGVWLAVLWWAVLIPQGAPPAYGVVRITALDVGQGSAILVETRHHRLLYDTGAIYPSGFDLGEAVVVPSLRRSRMPELDDLVLSHDDVDHTGGAAAVIRLLAPDRIWTSFPITDERWAVGSMRRCRRDVSWTWDAVRFRFLHPPSRWQGPDNDGSCVLLIDAPGGRALIAGDVSAKVERRLIKLPVDLAFAPHHGSATSSSMSFVRGFRPGIVFISTDRRSRYGHPHPEVLARFASARLFITGRDGALQWASDQPSQVGRSRSDSNAYWQGTWSREEISRPSAAGCPAGG